MLIISYDFTNDKTRANFSKFIKKFGRRIQYSVYEIKNSARVLQNIQNEIELVYKKDFKNTDSILIFSSCLGCDKKIKRYGYAANEEEEILFF
ncbi:MAG: CRISPR-associated endonuclease Cas2 [Patescibacteria group bacterium]